MLLERKIAKDERMVRTVKECCIHSSLPVSPSARYDSVATGKTMTLTAFHSRAAALVVFGLTPESGLSPRPSPEPEAPVQD
jgi:hypothetical protein